MACPIYMRDVAEVALGKELRTGAATENGHEVVMGTVFMLMGENSRDRLAARVARSCEEINRNPARGRESRMTVYDRTDLVDATIDTVKTNLLEGARARHRGALPAARKYPRRAHHRRGHPALDAHDHHRHGASEDQRQPDEPRRARLRASSSTARSSSWRTASGGWRKSRSIGTALLTRAERFDVVFDATQRSHQAQHFRRAASSWSSICPILTLTGVEGKMFHPDGLHRDHRAAAARWFFR